MMNANDALGFMEDMAILGQANAGVEDAMLRAQRNGHSRAALQASQTTMMAVVIKTKQEQLDQLQGQLNNWVNDRNITASLARANNRVLQSLINEHARATGASPDALRSQMNYLRSREFDKAISEGLERGSITIDPRQDRDHLGQVASWYIPEYD